MSKIYRCEKNHLLDTIEVIDEDGKCLCPHDNTRCHFEADTEDKQRIAELEKQNTELVAENERIWIEHYGCCDCANKNEHGWGCALNKQKECIANSFCHWRRKETK